MLLYVVPCLLIGLIVWQVQKPKLVLAATPQLKNNSYNDNFGPKTEVAEFERADKQLVLPKRDLWKQSLCNYLSQIKFQASRSRFEEIESLSAAELQSRGDLVNAMLYFLAGDGKPLVDKRERKLLQQQLENQSVLISSWLKARRQVYAAEYNRFVSRVEQLRRISGSKGSRLNIEEVN
jgi:hypothetical protein